MKIKLTADFFKRLFGVENGFVVYGNGYIRQRQYEHAVTYEKIRNVFAQYGCSVLYAQVKCG